MSNRFASFCVGMKLNRRRAIAFVALLMLGLGQASRADDPKPLTPEEAAKKVNEKVTVSMLVKSSGGRSHCYLNSEEDFMSESNFTIYIPSEIKEKFKKAGIDNPAEHYKKKTIEVTGRVILFEGKPRIPVTETSQIKIVESKKE